MFAIPIIISTFNRNNYVKGHAGLLIVNTEHLLKRVRFLNSCNYILGVSYVIFFFAKWQSPIHYIIHYINYTYKNYQNEIEIIIVQKQKLNDMMVP